MSFSKYDNEKNPVKYLETPDKSENDKKHYKTVVLSNGLKALLISEPIANDDTCGVEDDDEKLAAVALLVDVGSFSDPYKYQGLSHFIEKMICMGSKKYEIFYEQMEILCGDNDAETECEETVFYFQISEEHLDNCMDYFTDPLKAPTTLSKEIITSYRSTFYSDLPINLLCDDDERLSQLLAIFSNQSDPFNSFVKEQINDDDLHKELLAFHLRHYSAHRMYVCMQARLPMNELENLAIKHFSDIPSNNLPGKDFSKSDYRQAFTPQFHEEVYFVKPINQNVCKLELTWILPPMTNSYRCKPQHFMSYLIGYEGEGSLYVYLKKRLWCTDLNAYAASNPICTLFKVCINLTNIGFQHLDKVLHATFVYIQLLRQCTTLRAIYEELSTIQATNFRFASEKVYAYDNVKTCVKNFKNYAPKDILTGSQLYYEYDEEQIENIIKHLNEFNFNITITSQQKFNDDIQYDKKEKWYDTEYTSIKMPQKWQDLWSNCKPIREIYLPKPNPFLSTDFRIFSLENGKPKVASLAPKMILQSDICELWFRQDDKFLLPKAYMNFYFVSPLLRQSAKNSVLCALYVQLVEHHLVEQLYIASEAGLKYQFISTEKGVILMVNGYNEKLHLIVELIIEAMVSIKDHIIENQLEMFKKDLKNKFLKDIIYPEVLADNLLSTIVKNIHWSTSEKYECLNEITLSNIVEFARTFNQELYVRCLMQGNLTEEIAQNVLTSVMTTINCRTIKETKYVEDRGVKLPNGSNYIICKNIKNNIIDTVVKNYYQIGRRSLRIDSVLQLLMKIIEYPFIDAIRCKESLSYTHYFGISLNYGIIGYYFSVYTRETKFKSSFVEERIEAFHNRILQIVEEMSQEEFDEAKKSCIKVNQVVVETLYDENYHNWEETKTEEYIFDRRHRQIEVLRTLKKQDIIDFWIKHKGSNLRKLSINVVGNDMLNADKKDPETDEELFDKMDLKFIPREGSATTIVDINEFKQRLEVYPVTETILELEIDEGC